MKKIKERIRKIYQNYKNNDNSNDNNDNNNNDNNDSNSNNNDSNNNINDPNKVKPIASKQNRCLINIETLCNCSNPSRSVFSENAYAPKRGSRISL